MTSNPVREAFTLPLMFLTVALLGGLRIGTDVRLVAPPLSALVLALLLTACLVRAHLLTPERLMNTARTPLENLSGAIVLLSLFAASAQVFNLVTPDAGLLHLAFITFFFVQLLTMMAAGMGAVGMLRSLVVLLGSAFVIRWVLLEALYAPGTGTLKRVFTALAEGITLGTLGYEPHAPSTGYVAFLALAMYLGALALLPRSSPGALVRTSGGSTALRTSAVLLALLAAGCGAAEDRTTPAAEPAETDVAHAQREDALKRARIWAPPSTPVGEVSFSENPPGGFNPDEEVTCTFVREPVGGTTPKFNCRLPAGEVVKVKYGERNPELHAEVATTRLLAALGFRADRMFVVRSVHCLGCPQMPFQALKCHARTGRSACFAGASEHRPVTFASAVIERRAEGAKIEATTDQGWAWFELSRVDAKAGGASLAELDALRLLAVFLAHWDNKSANQRLICPPGAESSNGRCEEPWAMMQDVGATFGPLKLDLRNWRQTPVWVDARACRVSMKNLPWGGGTFPDHTISEDGRLLLLGLLQSLSEQQLTDLFVTSGITRLHQLNAEGRDPRRWLEAFRDKVKQIEQAGPCVSASAR